MKNMIMEIIAAMLQVVVPVIIILGAIWISAFYADAHIAEVLTISILSALASVAVSEFMKGKIEAKEN